MEIQTNKINLHQTRPESGSFIQSRLSQISAMRAEMSSLRVQADSGLPDLGVGVEVPAVDAVGWTNGHRAVDIRPRLWDKSAKKSRLVDTGAQLSATVRLPDDKVDDSVKLIAVNGSKIQTYGSRTINLKIGRKAYSIEAIVCDIKEDILGSDFINKYKLGMEWDDDQTELYMVDKKAKIKEPLKMVTVPTDLQRAHHLEEQSMSSLEPREAETILFEVSCMKKLDQKPGKNKISNEDALKMHDPEYADLVKSYPQLLNPSFQKGEPVHGVWHRIETGDHPPCKAKRRPIIANAAKAAKGKEAWDKMVEDGVIEKVTPGMNTDWSSALHIADKEGGGARPCSDFRALNEKTIVDAHPLPLLRDFTSKIHGAEKFSKVDLRSAFFNIPIWPAHRHKTLTLSPWGGSYIYNRLPFGLASGPASWQKCLESVLEGIEDIFIYLDDVLVWGKTKKHHDEVLNQVLERLAANDMALSIEKCLFGKDQVDYLGYHVSSSGIKPLQKKLQALKDFRNPTCQKDVLHFCGALNYFRTSLRGIKLPDGSFKSAAAVLQPLYARGCVHITFAL